MNFVLDLWYGTFINFILTHFFYPHSIPPANTQKALFYWCFQEVQNVNIYQKWVKDSLRFNISANTNLNYSCGSLISWFIFFENIISNKICTFLLNVRTLKQATVTMLKKTYGFFWNKIWLMQKSLHFFYLELVHTLWTEVWQQNHSICSYG